MHSILFRYICSTPVTFWRYSKLSASYLLLLSGSESFAAIDAIHLFIYNQPTNLMANEKEQQGQQLQIELTPEVANGNYSNLAIINHSDQEFVIDFVGALPGLPQARVNNRQILSPASAKRLLFALQENLVRYEKEFGTIELGAPQPQATEGVGRTATPFGNA